MCSVLVDIGLTFDLDSATIFLLLCLRHISPITKIQESLPLITICTFTLFCYLFDSYTTINKFHSFIMFDLLVNSVNLLVNCLVLIPLSYIHCIFSLKCYSIPLHNLHCTFYMQWCPMSFPWAVGYGHL